MLESVENICSHFPCVTQVSSLIICHPRKKCVTLLSCVKDGLEKYDFCCIVVKNVTLMEIQEFSLVAKVVLNV